ncbi:protocadherin gamma-C5-like [Protopterus annectens]|uniref:protocadherin gamma-C5-like n=1 Tax=Protopterus annectens TaxID=7888 RepID=UPI001CFBCA61|nr:protocadherin gamma-C5-like [Protopterus annectens]
MDYNGLRLSVTQRIFSLLFMFCIWKRIYGQMHYVISEELKIGSAVGNITKDLGLQLQSISSRNIRVVSKSSKQYFKLHTKDGILVVDDKLDREQLCGQSLSCFLHLQLIMENPLDRRSVSVEILDINDNSPQFSTENITLEITEAVTLGTSFKLDVAQDPDIGPNSVSTYWLTKNEHFELRVKMHDDGIKEPEIVLLKGLDREQQAEHRLILTAVDGGEPALSGTVNVSVKVLDANDNVPRFNKSVYNVRLKENVPVGTIVIQLKATDPDEGANGEIEYSLKRDKTSSNVNQVFSIDSQTGEIRTNSTLDFEETRQYTIHVIARDRGSPAAEEYCRVTVDLIDVNDNAPEVIINSLTNPIHEDATPETVVALLSVTDRDFGENGRVRLHLAPNIPFKLLSSFEDQYSLVTKGPLDREVTPQYNITIRATDSGSPSLSTQKLIFIEISDVNDNPPHFPQISYTIQVKENNHPGLFLCSLMAYDRDKGKNAKLSYSLRDNTYQNMHMSSYFYINSENGTLYSARSFDYEDIQVFQVQVEVEDGGTPPLRANTTVHVFILDENDNAPKVIYPKSAHGSLIQQTILRSAPVGYLVTKVVGVDEDSGHNAWLSYSLHPPQDTDFIVSLYSGEIRIAKSLQDLVETTREIVVEVKDNGKPALSTNVTLILSLEEKSSEGLSSSREIPFTTSDASDLTLYLIIALIAISFISFVTFAALTVNCLRNRKGDTFCSAAVCCYRDPGLDPKYTYDYSAGSLRIQLNSDGPLKYVDVCPSGLISRPPNTRSGFHPVSVEDDFLYMGSSSATVPRTHGDPISLTTEHHMDPTSMKRFQTLEPEYRTQVK